jgi:hypothetical protein
MPENGATCSGWHSLDTIVDDLSGIRDPKQFVQTLEKLVENWPGTYTVWGDNAKDAKEKFKDKCREGAEKFCSILNCPGEKCQLVNFKFIIHSAEKTVIGDWLVIGGVTKIRCSCKE